MKPILVLDNPEQLKGITHPLRMQILTVLRAAQAPRSASQLGEQLGVGTSKLYYHVVALEKLGLLEVDHVASKGNLNETYYVPAAAYFQVDPALLGRDDFGDAIEGFALRSLEEAATQLKLLVGGGVDPGVRPQINAILTRLRLSTADQQALLAELDALVQRFAPRSSEAHPHEMTVSLVAFPSPPGAREDDP